MISATAFMRSLQKEAALLRRSECEWKSANRACLPDSARRFHRRVLRLVDAQSTVGGPNRQELCPGYDRIFRTLCFLRRAQDPGRDQPRKTPSCYRRELP